MIMTEILDKEESGITGYSITKPTRRLLFQKFPPKYNFVGHHITSIFGASMGQTALPPTPTTAQVVGYTDDGSLEVLVIKIDGSIHRPIEGFYHLTWSKSKDRKSEESNSLLKNGWKAVEPVPIELVPGFFPIINRQIKHDFKGRDPKNESKISTFR